MTGPIESGPLPFTVHRTSVLKGPVVQVLNLYYGDLGRTENILIPEVFQGPRLV